MSLLARGLRAATCAPFASSSSAAVSSVVSIVGCARLQSTNASSGSSSTSPSGLNAPRAPAGAGAASSSGIGPSGAPSNVIDARSDTTVRRGAAKLSALDANPYGWEDEQRIAREAPLWMLYEAEREEVEITKRAGAGKKAVKDSKLQLQIPLLDSKGRAYATGGKKNATARVWVGPGDGKFTVNGKNLNEYFERLTNRQACIQPFVVTQSCGAFDVMATASGGGLSGQAGAVRHGVAQALARFDPQLKPLLRKFALIQRDPRMVERKKPGQKKARKQFQWVKR